MQVEKIPLISSLLNLLQMQLRPKINTDQPHLLNQLSIRFDVFFDTNFSAKGFPFFRTNMNPTVPPIVEPNEATIMIDILLIPKALAPIITASEGNATGIND